MTFPRLEENTWELCGLSPKGTVGGVGLEMQGVGQRTLFPSLLTQNLLDHSHAVSAKDIGNDPKAKVLVYLNHSARLAFSLLLFSGWVFCLFVVCLPLVNNLVVQKLPKLHRWFNILNCHYFTLNQVF